MAHTMATMGTDPVDVGRLLSDLRENLGCLIQTSDSPGYDENILRWTDVVVNRPVGLTIPFIPCEELASPTDLTDT